MLAVRRAIQAVEDAEGRITPDAVVRQATDPESPLHRYFEWDDQKAGHSYRIDQARRLIRLIEVVVTTDTRIITVPLYVRDAKAEGDEQGYVSLPRLRTEPDTAREMLRTEFSRASACLTRAEDLADALGLRKEVAAAARSVERVRRKIERQPRAN